MVIHLQPILLIPIFLLLLLFLPLNIRVEYLRKGEDDYFSLNICLLFKYPGLTFKITSIQNRLASLFTRIDTAFTTVWPWQEGEGLDREVVEKDIKLDELSRMLSKYADMGFISRVLKALRIRCREFFWETEFGWPNPALTGISAGFIWTIKGTILSLLDSYIIFQENPRLRVSPDFYHKKFQTCFLGIFSITIGNIIFTGFISIYYLLKGGFRQWGNIQLKN